MWRPDIRGGILLIPSNGTLVKIQCMELQEGTLEAAVAINVDGVRQ